MMQPGEQGNVSPDRTRRRFAMPEDRGSPAEQAIRDAMAEGAFDNLPGQGKPLPIAPPGGPRAAAFRVLKNAGFAPEWVELEHAIEEARSRMAASLAEYAARREAAVGDLQRLLSEAAGAAPARRRRWLARLRSGEAAARRHRVGEAAAALHAVNAAAEDACRAHLERLHTLNRMVDRANLIHPARGSQHMREDPHRAAAAFVERFPRLLLAAPPDAPPSLQCAPWDVPAEWLEPPAAPEGVLPRRVRGEVQVDALVEYRRRRQSGAL